MGIGNIGWTEFLVILAIALIFFGPRRLPGIAQAIGRSLREFQKALNEVKSEIAEAGRDADTRDHVRSILPRPADMMKAPASTAAGDEPAAESRGKRSEITPTAGAPERPSPGSTPDGNSGGEAAPGESDSQKGTAPSETEEDADDRGKDVP